MLTAPAIKVEGLDKTFPVTGGWLDFLRPGPRKRRSALRGVGFELERGKVLGLLGPNGAGKTTLIKVLCGLLLPEAGRVEVTGVDVVRDAAKAKHRIGLVVNEERSFYFRLTVRQNLRFFASLWDLSGPDLGRRVEEVLSVVGLADRAEERFDRLSTGMRQRAAIARGLLMDPDILLLDEPTRSLDPAGTLEVRRFVREQLVGAGGKTVVVATNNLDEAESLADELLVLRKGEVAAQGSLEAVKAQHGGRLVGLFEDLVRRPREVTL